MTDKYETIIDSTGTWQRPIRTPIKNIIVQASPRKLGKRKVEYIKAIEELNHRHKRKRVRIKQHKQNADDDIYRNMQINTIIVTAALLLNVVEDVVTKTKTDSQTINTVTPTKEDLNVLTVKDSDSKSKDSFTLLLDSGSSICCVKDERHLSNIRDVTDSNFTVVDAGNNKHVPEKMGTLNVMIDTTDGYKQIQIKNVYLIKTFDLNILSVRQMQREGWGVYFPPTNNFVKHGYSITPTQYTINHMVLPSGLEAMKMRHISASDIRPLAPRLFNLTERTTEESHKPFQAWLENAPHDHLLQRLQKPIQSDGIGRQRAISHRLADLGTFAVPAQDAQTNAYLKLHHKLGHCSPRATMKFAQQYMTSEERKALGAGYLRLCSSCERANARRRPIAKKAVTPRIPKFAWQHSSADVIGKYKHLSITKQYAYALVIVCHKTNYCRSYGITSLKQLPKVMNEHLDWVKSTFPASYKEMQINDNPTKHSAMKTLKSDAHNVFKTKDMQAIYGKHNMTHITSPPHTQSRNGRIESLIGRIKASASAMRAARQLGPPYWWLAFRHATHLHNILPKKANDGIAPHEVLFDSKPDISHLYSFGATGYIKRSVKIGEAQHKGIAGLYMGWYPNSLSHLILIPATSGGVPSLRKLQMKQDGALPPTQKHRMMETVHISVDDKLLPNTILKGEVPLHVKDSFVYDENEHHLDECHLQDSKDNDTYTPSILRKDDDINDIYDRSIFDDEDDDDESSWNDHIENFNDRREVQYEPSHHEHDVDQTDENVIDIDYHETHCVTRREQCMCIHNEKTPHINVGAQVHSIQSSDQKDEGVACDDALLHPYPRVLTIGKIYPNWTSASETEYEHMFHEARKSEMQAMKDRGILHKIPISQVPKGERLFTSSMLFTLKGDGNNNIERAKARWVFGGHRQIEGVHYQDSASFCPRWSSIRTFLAIAAKKNRKIKSGDITTAFLFADASSTLYMKSPRDQVEYCEKTGDQIVYKVTGNLYGRKDAGRQWMLHFTTFLKSIGFKPNKIDPCLFDREIRVGGKLQTISLVTYVDDLCYHGNSTDAIQLFEEQMESKFGPIKSQFPTFFLGCNFTQTENKIHISNKAMIERMFMKFYPSLTIDQIDLTKATTPFPSHGSSLGSEVLHSDSPKDGEPPIQQPYRELVGGLSYIGLTTRPDIAFYTSQLAKVQANPGEKHWRLAKHVLRYCIATMSHGVTYRYKGDDLKYYVDASWADITPNYTMKDGIPYIDPNQINDDGRRSSYGYVGFYASGPVSWAAKVHKGRRALSTMESELIAACEAAKDIVHMRQLLNAFNIYQRKPTILYEDNQSTIKSVMRDGITARSKHIETRWYYIRELQGSEIDITKKHTSEQIADIYTKRLSAETFEYLRKYLVQKPQYNIVGCILISQVHEELYQVFRNCLVLHDKDI